MPASPKPTLCLNMIVKNEAHVIKRCLASARPWIDRWVIVDTGSSDGTPQVIRDFMAGVPGELHERPWKNFAHNRNEALQLARAAADYLLFIDADEQLQMPTDFQWPTLEADGYFLTCHMAGTEYQRNALIATRRDWHWEGVLHEYLTAPNAQPWQQLPGPVIYVSHDGARAKDPNTYLKDIALLEDALKADPGNTRNVFYLAQSYRDAQRLPQSLERYRQRADMGGWEEERWFAQFQVAKLLERTGAAPEVVREAYLTTYVARPQRAEPLCELARFCRERKEYALGALFALQASQMAMPTDILFVDASVYRWRALDELAVNAFYTPHQSQGREALKQLLAQRLYPESERVRIEGNQQFYRL
ncbi:glycosyltransferase [Diaphorobacter sp. HDW4A]|uniref:glycosyltransferase n=1 Tax=Diaphorobacter sp. HDW4A TaxID=2714924 RepID=UPI001407B0EB|nr:glycosyltransferase [Diaphorobacter sp. HDW4A]QIL83072.1 glycosyltransferase [Diaphorobacter sp. HDW4A]